MKKHDMTYSVRIKGKYYIAIVSYREGNKQRQKTRTTKIEAGTKKARKEAEEFAKNYRDKFEEAYLHDRQLISESVLVVDFFEEWLENRQKTRKLRAATINYYRNLLDYHFIPYFKPLALEMKDVTPRIIEKYLVTKSEKMGTTTLYKHYQALHAIFQYAYVLEVVEKNIVDRIEAPKKKKPIHNEPYNYDEIQRLIEAVKGTQIEVPVIITCFYGLRREEVLGLKYSAIDFEKNMIHINHTATVVGGKVEYIDATKNTSSNRVLPLSSEMKEYIVAVKKKQEQEKKLCGNAYYDSDYICRHADGTLIKPAFLSDNFKRLLEKNNMRHIRFHDLRHSAATNLIRGGTQAKNVQEWLGHSDIGTTLNLYTNFGYEDKLDVAETIGNKLKI